MADRQRKLHPSGRPIRKEVTPKQFGYLRPPHEGYINPRLKPKERVLDIGFYQAFRNLEENDA